MLNAVYCITGLLLCGFAWFTMRDVTHPRRHWTALFWLLLGIVFIAGQYMPYWVSGVLVLIMVAIDGAGGVARAPSAHEETPPSLGRRVFWPVVVIPLVTFAVAAAHGILGMDPSKAALVGLGAGGVVAALSIWRLSGCKFCDVLDDGRRLNETMGSVNILPQLLASLGAIFTAAGIGQMLAAGITRVVPAHSLFLVVLANCVAVTSFSFLMGNSFASIPVIASGIMVPLLVKPFGVPPEMAAIITLTAGSSGTLMTPMAANFNMVPAALLEMRDTYGVVKFQLPYAFAMWSCHVLLLYGFCRWLA